MRNLVKIVLDIVQDKSRLKRFIIFAAGLALVALLAYSAGRISRKKGTERITSTEPLTEYQAHEIGRTLRMIETIDEKTRAEVNANEKISVDDSRVLAVLDDLMRSRSAEKPHAEKR